VPSYPGLSQRLGSLYQALGRVDDAAKAYEAALKGVGTAGGLKFSAASFFLSIKKCERAREIAEQITNEDPRNSDANELLARIWECNGKMDQALLSIKHAIDVSDKPQYHLTHAKLLERLDKGQEALGEYETAANRGHLPDAYVGRARLSLNYGANKDAIHDLELALKLDKNRADAMALQGKAFLNLQQYGPGKTKLQQAVKLLPKDAEAHYWLAEACRGANDFSCAAAHYREATRLGLVGEDQGDAYYKLGMYERSHGSQGGARDAFRKCIEIGTEVQKTNCGREIQTLGGYQ
jgi:tetratricopeptide (TPR) repeat protein